MNIERNRMLSELCAIRESIYGEFAALALGVGDGRMFRWILVSGSQRERSEKMSFRTGRGVGGQAIRIGRTMIWNPTDPQLDLMRRECPLMMAERLKSAVTAPVVVQMETRGVILVGSRTGRLFTDNDMAAVAQAARRIGDLTNANRIWIH